MTERSITDSKDKQQIRQQSFVLFSLSSSFLFFVNMISNFYSYFIPSVADILQSIKVNNLKYIGSIFQYRYIDLLATYENYNVKIISFLLLYLHNVAKLIKNQITSYFEINAFESDKQSFSISGYSGYKNKPRRHFNNFYRLQTTRLNCERILYLANGLIVYTRIS